MKSYIFDKSVKVKDATEFARQLGIELGIKLIKEVETDNVDGHINIDHTNNKVEVVLYETNDTFAEGERPDLIRKARTQTKAQIQGKINAVVIP